MTMILLLFKHFGSTTQHLNVYANPPVFHLLHPIPHVVVLRSWVVELIIDTLEYTIATECINELITC